MQKLPLFPLNTVLFPGGLLPLRIFETRYLDMISQCLRSDSGFIVSLITEGKEVGAPANAEDLGVSVRIIDWESLPGGLLGVTVQAEQKMRIVDTDVQSNGMVVATAEPLPPEAEMLLQPSHQPMVQLLKRILSEIPLPYTDEMIRLDSANWVSDRLTELLPFPHALKQAQLREPDPEIRLATMEKMLHELELLG